MDFKEVVHCLESNLTNFLRRKYHVQKHIKKPNGKYYYRCPHHKVCKFTMMTLGESGKYMVYSKGVHDHSAVPPRSASPTLEAPVRRLVERYVAAGCSVPWIRKRLATDVGAHAVPSKSKLNNYVGKIRRSTAPSSTHMKTARTATSTKGSKQQSTSNSAQYQEQTASLRHSSHSYSIPASQRQVPVNNNAMNPLTSTAPSCSSWTQPPSSLQDQGRHSSSHPVPSRLQSHHYGLAPTIAPGFLARVGVSGNLYASQGPSSSASPMIQNSQCRSYQSDPVNPALIPNNPWMHRPPPVRADYPLHSRFNPESQPSGSVGHLNSAGTADRQYYDRNYNPQLGNINNSIVSGSVHDCGSGLASRDVSGSAATDPPHAFDDNSHSNQTGSIFFDEQTIVKCEPIEEDHCAVEVVKVLEAGEIVEAVPDSYEQSIVDPQIDGAHCSSSSAVDFLTEVKLEHAYQPTSVLLNDSQSHHENPTEHDVGLEDSSGEPGLADTDFNDYSALPPEQQDDVDIVTSAQDSTAFRNPPPIVRRHTATVSKYRPALRLSRNRSQLYARRNAATRKLAQMPATSDQIVGSKTGCASCGLGLTAVESMFENWLAVLVDRFEKQDRRFDEQDLNLKRLLHLAGDRSNSDLIGNNAEDVDSTETNSDIYELVDSVTDTEQLNGENEVTPFKNVNVETETELELGARGNYRWINNRRLCNKNGSFVAGDEVGIGVPVCSAQGGNTRLDSLKPELPTTAGVFTPVGCAGVLDVVPTSAEHAKVSIISDNSHQDCDRYLPSTGDVVSVASSPSVLHSPESTAPVTWSDHFDPDNPPDHTNTAPGRGSVNEHFPNITPVTDGVSATPPNKKQRFGDTYNDNSSESFDQTVFDRLLLNQIQCLVCAEQLPNLAYLAVRHLGGHLKDGRKMCGRCEWSAEGSFELLYEHLRAVHEI